MFEPGQLNGIELGYRLDDQGTVSRLALGPTQPPI